MKTKTLLAIAVTLGLTGVSYAEKPERDRKNRVDRPIPREILEKFDKDGDGKLSEDERKAARKELMEKHEAHRKEILAKYDTDGDGELSEEERKAMRKDFAKKFDKDGDGKLSDEEKEEMKKAMSERHGKRGDADKRKEHRKEHREERKEHRKEHREGGADEAPGVLGE